MTIKLEIDSASCTMVEWSALSAFIRIMEGKTKNSTLDMTGRKKPLPDIIPESKTEYEVKNSEGWTASFDPQGFVSEQPPVIAPADNPETGIVTDAALQSAGFGTGNVAGGAAVPAATIAPPAPHATPPAPPVPATAPAADGALRDSKGLPWDHRIHSSSRSQNKDSSWRYKKGIDDSVIASVEAELRAVLNVSAPVPSVPAVPAPPAPPVPGAPSMTFMQLLPKVTGAIKAGTLAQETVNAILVEFSLPNLPAIHHRPDLVQAFHDRLFGGA